MPATADPKNVLILSQGPGQPNVTMLQDIVIEALRQGGDEPLNIYEELIDSIRFQSEEYDRQLAALFKAKYPHPALALVIALTEPALDFALRHRDELFPNVPLLFGAVDERAIRGRTLGQNVTGLFSQVDAQETVAAALTLHPGVRHIIVVGGTSRFDRGFIDVIRPDLRAFDSRASVSYLIDKPLRDVLAAVAALRDDGLVLFVSMQLDGEGVARTGPEVLGALRHATTAPIYGMSKNYHGHGIVGGVVLDYERQGTDLGQRARRILDGLPPASLVPTKAQNTIAFDWRELQRFGIDEARLPAGATVLNRELSLWDEYRRTIFVVAAALIGQSLLIGGLLVQHRRRRHSEGRTRAILRALPDFIFVQTAAGVYVDYHARDAGQLFVPPGQFLGRHMREVLPPTLLRTIEPAFAQVAGATEPVVVEYNLELPHGNRHYEARLVLGNDNQILTLVRDISERKQSEDALRENEAALRASNREIQDLAGRLIASQEDERARIARELHDDFSQQIAGLSIALSALKRQIGGFPGGGDLSVSVSSLQRRALALAEHVRHLSHDLHPTVLQHSGLVPALAAYCANLERQQLVTARFSVEGDVEPTDSAASLCLYRVAQEALRNVVTHAQAHYVEVRLLRIGDDDELTIADDGVGFDIKETAKSVEGLGLVSINERARLLGGTASIVTEMNKGTRVRVRIPANGQRLSLS